MTKSPNKLDNTGKITPAMSALTLNIRRTPGKYIQPRKGLFCLGQLPVDIRYLIYEFILVEPKRRDIEHKSDCFWHSDRLRLLEPSAFLLKDIVISEEPHRLIWDLDGYCWSGSTMCRCDQRKGLGLLLTNRQVHAEAAPLFWSQNNFSFLSGHEAITALNHLVRPEYRDLISSITVLSADQRGTPCNVRFASDTTQGCGPVPWDSFWLTMMRCRNLKAIEVPTIALETCLDGFHQLATEKPALNTNLVDFIPFRKWEDNLFSYPAGTHIEECYDHKHFTIYAETSSRLPTVQELRSSDEEPCIDIWKTRARESKNLLRRTREVIIETCLRNFDEQHVYQWRLRPIIDSKETRFVRLDLGEGKYSSVKFYGLPASLKEARQLAWKEHLEDEEFKKLKGMYPSHHKSKIWHRWFREVVEEEGLTEEEGAELRLTGYYYTLSDDAETADIEPPHTQPNIDTSHLQCGTNPRRENRGILWFKRTTARYDAEQRRKEKKRDLEMICRESLDDDDDDWY
ncbi:hypothetical protein CMEL01_05103 [Colletotrichum melonis]|uniref:DUF7730 domain-containing protein n=1 Tax=Colletotrichum melonis TaxID=1209925 RepID=A0AAI9UAL3_9PEZI|nr:hypothetical protein CMEL01_05103 [Colletotrichum melonis]